MKVASLLHWAAVGIATVVWTSLVAKDKAALSLANYVVRILVVHFILSTVQFLFENFVYNVYLNPIVVFPTPKVDWPTRLYRWILTEPAPPQLLEWARRTPNDGVIRYTGIGGSQRLLLTNQETMREVLVSKQYTAFERPLMARKRIAVLAGNGLIASAGDIHKAQKKKLLPAFSTKAIRDLYPLFWNKATELVDTLKGHDVVNMNSWSSRAALDVIGVAAWGRDFDALRDPESAFLRAYTAMFEMTAQGQLVNALGLILPMSLIMRLPLDYNKRVKAAIYAVRGRSQAAVSQRSRDSKDILNMSLNSGLYDEKTVVEQLMTILSAGHETSGVTMTWACYLLSQHPDVQQRLREEIRKNVPAPGTDISADMFDLPYLRAVANEVLRLYPAVHTTRREAIAPTSISGHAIPVDTHIVTSAWVVNRLHESTDFDPERWLKTDADIPFFSFSMGPRSCIGQNFARGEFLVMLAAVVGRYKLTLDETQGEPNILFGITATPAGGINIKLQQVEGW